MCFRKKKFIRKVFKKAAKTFEARDFFNMFLRFVCSFSNETFSYKKDLLHLLHSLYTCYIPFCNIWKKHGNMNKVYLSHLYVVPQRIPRSSSGNIKVPLRSSVDF